MNNSETLYTSALLVISEQAVKLSLNYDTLKDPFLVIKLLDALLSLEACLDQGRVLTAGEQDLENFAVLNRNMDLLRKNIRIMLDKEDQEEMIEFLENRGERTKTQFTV